MYTTTLNLLIDSKLTRLRNPNRRNKTHDFRMDLNPPIELAKGRNYRTAMKRLINMIIITINKLKCRKNTENRKILVFPDGIYDFEDLNVYLQV